MAHGNPTNSSPWTGTLLAPFARRRYRTVDDLPRGSSEPWPAEAEDFVGYRSNIAYEEEEEDSQASKDGEEDNDRGNRDASLHAKHRSTYPVDDDQSAADDDFIVVKEDSTSQSAIAAWNRNFSGQPRLELAREDALPFTIGQRLGGGGVGIVFETHIEGVPLALKRTYTRRVSSQQLNEIKILGRMSKTRHQHVVDLIGSYVHKQRGGFEIGMLIWPVARTDLAALLHDINFFTQCCLEYEDATSAEQANSASERIQTAMEPLVFIKQSELYGRFLWEDQIFRLLTTCWARIRLSLGCIANAVAYLHQQKIRHKDLKPSQILLSTHGLWLADFGWSVDMSEQSSSITSGGEKTTAKYQAPERANRKPCGRSEDVFALGCIYLEMSYRIDNLTGAAPLPWMQRDWSFQANLTGVQDWLKPLREPSSYHRAILADLFERMLDPISTKRPSIDAVIEMLYEPPLESCYVDTCCTTNRRRTYYYDLRTSPARTQALDEDANEGKKRDHEEGYPVEMGS